MALVIPLCRDRSCHTVNSISSTNYHFQAVDSAAVHLKHQASPLEQVQATWRAVRAQSRRSMIDCATGQSTEGVSHWSVHQFKPDELWV